MTDDQAIARWLKAVEQARKDPGGYITLPSSVIVALAEMAERGASAGEWEADHE